MKNVLIIDDSDVDNYIFKHIIMKSKIAVTVTAKNSAIDALEYLETLINDPEAFPDHIFLDIHMPHMDGFGFLERFIKLPKNCISKSSVIMLSSSRDQNDVERSTQYSVVTKFLNKPFEISMLETV